MVVILWFLDFAIVLFDCPLICVIDSLLFVCLFMFLFVYFFVSFLKLPLKPTRWWGVCLFEWLFLCLFFFLFVCFCVCVLPQAARWYGRLLFDWFFYPLFIYLFVHLCSLICLILCRCLTSSSHVVRRSQRAEM